MFRLIGIQWGLKNDLHNQSYHPDELVNFGVSQQIDLSQGKLLPHFYDYGTLYFTIESISSKVVSSYFGGPASTSGPDWDWIGRCELAARVVSALFGAGTAVFMFAIMRRFTTPMGAILSAIVIAVAPAHVVHSRFATVDVTALFFIAASTYASLLLLPATSDEKSNGANLTDAGAMRIVCLSGLYAGLSAGVKYAGILVLLTLFAALFLAKRKRWILEALIGAGVAGLAFVVSTPGCLLEQDVFIRNVKAEMLHVATGHGYLFLNTPPGYVYHLSNLFVGLGTLLTLVCLVGLIVAAWKKKLWALAMLAFFVPYYVVIGREEVKFLRYTFPLYVGLAAGFGWVVAACHRRRTESLESGTDTRLARGVATLGVLAGIGGLGGLDFGGMRSAATLTAQMVQEDPRDSAVRYLRSVAEPTTHVGVGRDIWYWSIPLMRNSDLPASVGMPQRLEQMFTTCDPPVAYILQPNGGATTFSSDLITKAKPEFIAFTSIEAQDLLRLASSKNLPPGTQGVVNDTARFMNLLKDNYDLDRAFGAGGFSVEDMRYITPQVYIWKRKPAPSKSP